jgi:adenosylcobinamide-GDP ribazoletransferase
VKFDPAQELRLFLAALQFMTRLPTPAIPYDPDWLPRAAKYFPLTGILIGVIAAAVLVAAERIWPNPIPALLALGAGILITGALHEDGVADSADSLGGRTREARLAIMKDSRIGTFGVLALLLALALQAAALASMPAWIGAAYLVAAHAGARLAAVIVMKLAPYAGDRAVAKVEHAPDRPGAGETIIALLLGLLPLFAMSGDRAMPGLALGTLAALAVARRLCRGLGGYTGDVLGAVVVAFSTGFLLGAAHPFAGG